jgi:nitrite reductase/ring-hydroxylating ferredoxin subunit
MKEATDMYEREESMALARRALAHLNHRSTDQAENTMEVPASVYANPLRYEQEIERVFRRSPLPLAFSVELPGPGTYRAMTIAGVPVLLVRGQDGVVRSFVNACRHRGSQLCKPGAGAVQRLVCPYHAWQYDLEGRLRGVYGEATFGEVDRQTHSLVPLPVAEKCGVVWGTLTPGAEFEVDAWLGKMAAQLDTLDLGGWHIHVQREFEGPTWKTAWDGYLESYHHAILHTSTVARYTVGNLIVHDSFGVHQRMVFGQRSLDQLNTLPEDEWEPDRHIRRIFHVFPNMAVSAMLGDKCLINQIFPGPTQTSSITRQTIMLARKPQTQEEVSAADEFAEVTVSAIRDEDYPINSGVQVGLLSGRAPSVVFGRNEPALQHYHKTLARLMGE